MAEHIRLIRSSKAAATLALAIALIVLPILPSAFGANPFLRDPDRDSIVLNVAHAGASSIAPQNTLAGGRAAFDAGADVWGVDVRCTADGVFVLMHDATLDRTTDIEDVFPDRAPWRVDAFTFDEIRELDAGSWFLDEDPFGEIAAGEIDDAILSSFVGEPVPTLREALELVVARGGLIDLEIKEPEPDGYESIARGLVSLIAETCAGERVLVSSFDHGFLRVLRETAPDIAIGALNLFPPHGGAGELDALGADAYLPSIVGWTPELIAELLELGIGVIPWTINDPGTLHWFASMTGVLGIYTDYPRRLAAALADLRDGSLP